MIVPEIESIVTRYVIANGIRETSVPALVRVCVLIAPVNVNVLGFSQIIGRILVSLGFERYRPMIDGVRSYRYRRGGIHRLPERHDPPLHPAEIFDVHAGGGIDPYTLKALRRSRLGKTTTPIAERDRAACTIYMPKAQLEELAARARAEGLPLATFARRLLRLALPHAPVGAVLAAGEGDQPQSDA